MVIVYVNMEILCLRLVFVLRCHNNATSISGTGVLCLVVQLSCFVMLTLFSSPFRIVLAPASAVAAERSVASGYGVTQTVEGCTSSFLLHLKDVYSNPIDAPLVCRM